MQQDPENNSHLVNASISDGEGRTVPQGPVKVTTITRLSPEVYRKFEDSLSRAVIDKNANDAGCDAAYKLGIQYVLHRLRSDLVVE